MITYPLTPSFLLSLLKNIMLFSRSIECNFISNQWEQELEQATKSKALYDRISINFPMKENQ